MWSEKAERLIEMLPDGIVIVNSDGSICSCNLSFSMMSGYPKYELLGKKIDELVPVGVSQNHQKYREEYNKNPRYRSMGISPGQNLKLQTRSKDLVDIRVSLIPLGDGQTAAVLRYDNYQAVADQMAVVLEATQRVLEQNQRAPGSQNG